MKDRTGRGRDRGSLGQSGKQFVVTDRKSQGTGEGVIIEKDDVHIRGVANNGEHLKRCISLLLWMCLSEEGGLCLTLLEAHQ